MYSVRFKQVCYRSVHLRIVTPDSQSAHKAITGRPVEMKKARYQIKLSGSSPTAQDIFVNGRFTLAHDNRARANKTKKFDSKALGRTSALEKTDMTVCLLGYLIQIFNFSAVNNLWKIFL